MEGTGDEVVSGGGDRGRGGDWWRGPGTRWRLVEGTGDEVVTGGGDRGRGGDCYERTEHANSRNLMGKKVRLVHGSQ